MTVQDCLLSLRLKSAARDGFPPHVMTSHGNEVNPVKEAFEGDLDLGLVNDESQRRGQQFRYARGRKSSTIVQVL